MERGRKSLRYCTLIGLALILSHCTEAQNLVPNPSFEENSGCPLEGNFDQKVDFWFNARPTCDYYHECEANGNGIPINTGGGGYARTGLAYAGFKVWCINSRFVGREVLGVELLEPLHVGVIYRVEFYLSMMDSIWYGSKNVGAYFSALQPDNDIDSIEGYQPQVQYDGDFITDKEGWTRVSGTFVAQGGERFLSIGNFDKYEDTEILFVHGGGVNPWHSNVYWSCAAYFIDDVSVVPDSITGIMEENENPAFSVYPNPSNGIFTLQTSEPLKHQAQLLVYDMQGRAVLRQQVQRGARSVTVQAEGLSEGIYLLSLEVNGELRLTERLSIVRD